MFGSARSPSDSYRKGSRRSSVKFWNHKAYRYNEQLTFLQLGEHVLEDPRYSKRIGQDRTGGKNFVQKFPLSCSPVLVRAIISVPWLRQSEAEAQGIQTNSVWYGNMEKVFDRCTAMNFACTLDQNKPIFYRKCCVVGIVVGNRE